MRKLYRLTRKLYKDNEKALSFRLLIQVSWTTAQNSSKNSRYEFNIIIIFFFF